MDSFLDVCMICFLEGAEAVAESRRPRGRDLSYLRMCFFCHSIRSCGFSIFMASNFGNVHFLSRQRPLSLRGQVFPLPPRKRSTRYSDALRSAGEKGAKRGNCHVALGFESWLLTNCLHCYFSGEL